MKKNANLWSRRHLVIKLWTRGKPKSGGWFRIQLSFARVHLRSQWQRQCADSIYTRAHYLLVVPMAYVPYFTCHGMVSLKSSNKNCVFLIWLHWQLSKKINISTKRSDRRIDAIHLMKLTTALLAPRAIQNSIIVCATITLTRKCNKSWRTASVSG